MFSPNVLSMRVIRFFNYPFFNYFFDSDLFIQGEFRVKKSFKLLVVAVGLMAISATASAFSTKPCKACHAIDKDVVGPAWKKVADAYGSPAALAAVFKGGFKPEDRKIGNSEPKFKKQEAVMTAQFKTLIKGHEDDAANALFEAVKSGKIGD